MTSFATTPTDTLYRWLALHMDAAIKAEISRELERRATPLRKAA